MINQPDWINYAYEKEPDIEMLKKALKNEQWLITDRETKLKAIRLKYQAMTTVPTIIEKTMTPAQLYTSNSPLWAHDYTTEEIRNILERLKSKPRTEETFNIALRSIQNPMLIMDEFGNLKLNKSHPRNKATLVKQEHLT